MAKRVPQGQAPYRPLDKVLVQSVLAGASDSQVTSPAGGANAATAVAEAPRVAEPPRMPASPTPTNVVAMPPSPSAAQRREQSAPSPDLALERRSREKRVLLTRSEERDVERLVGRIAGELNTPVKLSHVLRAAITTLLHAEDELVDRARKSTLVRPGNGNAPELAEFEHGLAQILSAAFREVRPMR